MMSWMAEVSSSSVLFGEEFLDYGCLCQFFVGKVLTVFLGIDGGALLALFYHADKGLEGVFVTYFTVVSGLCLDEQQFGLDALQGSEAHFVASKHCCFDASADVIKNCHNKSPFLLSTYKVTTKPALMQEKKA